MPFTDNVSSVSGRNSRASNVSGITGASQSIRSQRPPAMPQSDTLASAGVLSMLKTSTDTGDIGALSFNKSRLPAPPRATHQRRGHHKRLSGSSNNGGIAPHHHYAPSQTSRISSSREWDSMSNQQRRGSLTSMQSMPTSLPPVHLGKGPYQMVPTPSDDPRDSRSFSLTSVPPGQPLPRHRSAASLKSQGHEPRHHHPPPHARQPHPPPMIENRPQYVYPTRLKRPGYRSPSPALSETYAQAPPPVPPMGRRPHGPPRPQPQRYISDYGPEYNPDPRHLNKRPPPRAASNSPVLGYSDPAQPMPSQPYPYRNPAANRSAPGLSMPPHAQGPGHHGGPARHPPGMHRQPYPGQPYPPRPGYAPYPQQQYPGHRGPPPPPPSVAPMVHQMFHNAARMARQVPLRTDTPMTDISPPSSDPPSSGTAPSASSPPTPKDQTSIQVAIDPAFIDPALMDLPDSSSEPALAHQYLRYAEALEKELDEPEIDVHHASVPPNGFVQRVKAMLESKAAAEAQIEAERVKAGQPSPVYNVADIVVEDEQEEIHELAANETPRFTIIEEYEAPVELPASPVRIPELAGSPVDPKRRITREMMKAELGPSSVDNTVNQTDTFDVTTKEEIRPRKSASHHATEDPVVTEEEAINDEPSTPGPVATKCREDAGPDTGSTSSPITLGLSAVDYAVRYNTTATTEETQSKDPFILDADTITLQQQRSRNTFEKPELISDAKQPDLPEPPTETEHPVSPILTGEDVSRCSAVSPLHTQTLGIDETLNPASEPAQAESESTEEPTMPGAFPEDKQPPPTPRTPKTYSKSVQIPRSEPDTDTPSSNRFSLPPDLSTIDDTSMNTTSDIVTDVAVRFSLPQTTVTVSKPHIVEIPPSSSPVREPPEPQLPKPAARPPQSKSKRNSVTFADEVAPLKISKRPEQQPNNVRTGDQRLSKGKSIVRGVSPLQETAEANRMTRDNTTDLRFSGINAINSRFGSTQLPRLKEESIDEMSLSDKHKSELTNGFQFPLPARIAAVKAMQERRLQESAEKAKARRARHHPNRPLAETRDLPSLNFSRMDLIDKLNEALEVRESKSMEVIRHRDFSTIYCPSPQRPMSTEPLRERYTSFFSKPEDFSSFFNAQNEVEVDDESEEEQAPETGVPTVQVQPNTEVDLIESTSRPLSPEDFLHVATEINRLSIPSVSGLSDRLSELLPNLKDLHLDSVLANFGDVVEDIHLLGDGTRPETVLSTRTSAGFRSLAERAEEIVKNSTHDSIAAVTALRNKALPPLPGSKSVDKVTSMTSTDAKLAHLSGSVSLPADLGKDVSRPASAFTRTKSPLTEDEVRELLPPEMNPIARHSKRALVISSGSSRPWNQDENYPWAGTKLDVDLTVPTRAYVRDSTNGDIVRNSKSKSLDITSTGMPTATSKGIDIGSILEHDRSQSSPTNEQLTGVSIATTTHHTTKPSKHSVLGSLTRKIGLGCKADTTKTECNTTGSISVPAMLTEGARSASTIAHRPGERYPTSGLTPPAGFNLDEVRSFFSDDSSEKERNASFRKRLTNLNKLNKGKNSRSDRHLAARTPNSLDQTAADTTYDAGELNANAERIGAVGSAHTYDGVGGMGKTEFRIKRFGEKLRHLMLKGGELIRSLSQRSKPQRAERVRDDWLSDSLYSGV